MAEAEAANHLLVIGGSSIIGRRIRQIAKTYSGQVTLTGATRLAAGDLYLNMLEPARFAPKDKISDVIVCAPIWFVEDALLSRLSALGMKRLVVFSSTSLLTKKATTDAYEQEMVARLDASETRIKEYCDLVGAHWTILRPTLIYDEGWDRNVTQIYKAIKLLHFFPVAGSASGMRRPVHAGDLASASIRVLRTFATIGKTYTLSGGEALSYREMVRRIFQGMKRSPRIVSMPLLLWRLAFLVKAVLHPSSQTNFEMARRMNQDMDFGHEPASEDFGYSPRPFRPIF